MKKRITLCLFVCIGFCIANTQAQEKVITARDTFSFYPSGESPLMFHFDLGHGNRMKVNMLRTVQLNDVVSLDSIMQQFWTDFLPLRDSFSNELTAKFVDYFLFKNGHQFSLRERASMTKTYRYRNDELVQLKTTQDTIRINIPTRSWSTAIKLTGGKDSILSWVVVTLSLNNLDDLAKVKRGTFDSALTAARISLANNMASKKSWKPLSFSYDEHFKQNNSIYLPWSSRLRWEFIPVAEFGVQYARGAWSPSAAAGMQLTQYKGKDFKQSFRLMWEPYFFFSKNIDNKLVTDRNDFITIQYKKFDKLPYDKEGGYLNFSLGYLVRRQGNWFNANTFKVTLPGYSFNDGYMQLQPLFFFNDFFKNFSPTLQLLLEIQ